MAITEDFAVLRNCFNVRYYKSMRGIRGCSIIEPPRLLIGHCYLGKEKDPLCSFYWWEEGIDFYCVMKRTEMFSLWARVYKPKRHPYEFTTLKFRLYTRGSNSSYLFSKALLRLPDEIWEFLSVVHKQMGNRSHRERIGDRNFIFSSLPLKQ